MHCHCASLPLLFPFRFQSSASRLHHYTYRIHYTTESAALQYINSRHRRRRVARDTYITSNEHTLHYTALHCTSAGIRRKRRSNAAAAVSVSARPPESTLGAASAGENAEAAAGHAASSSDARESSRSSSRSRTGKPVFGRHSSRVRRYATRISTAQHCLSRMRGALETSCRRQLSVPMVQNSGAGWLAALYSYS